jgi:hypothetical protein
MEHSVLLTYPKGLPTKRNPRAIPGRQNGRRFRSKTITVLGLGPGPRKRGKGFSKNP